MALAIDGVAETMFHVYDVPTSVAFYRDVLGFEIVHHSAPFTDAKDDFGWVMLRRGEAQLMLNNAYEDNLRPPVRDPARTAAHGDTTIYFQCADVDAAYAFLLSRGVAAREPFVTYYGMKQVYFKDPDGYSLCVQQPA